MPARARGSTYKTATSIGIRWYDRDGRRRLKSGFRSKSEARIWWEEAIRLELEGRCAIVPETTFDELGDRYLRAHAAAVQPRTIRSLRERLQRPLAAFGDVPVRELENQVAEIAAWRAGLPERYRFAITLAFKQVLRGRRSLALPSREPGRAVGPNPPLRSSRSSRSRPPMSRRSPRLGPVYGPLVVFAAETALRPEEWAAVRRGDLDREHGVVRVERTSSWGREALREDDEFAPLGAALLTGARRDRGAPRPAPYAASVPGPAEVVQIRLNNWRRRDWLPALYGAGVDYRPPYAMRHTAISRWLAADVPIFDVSRFAGTSLQMVERVYGHMVAGSAENARVRLDAFREHESNRLGEEQASDR